MKLIEGQLIHRRYRLDSRLAQGGMGEVWKGYDIQLGREVAIKALRSDVTNAEAKLRRLRAEAHNSANLAHPNIAALFEYYEHDGIGFLIMEYVPSKSLADLFHSKGAMDPVELLPILIQTARGLFVAHSHGVIHRDVKPANIMVSDTGEVKITDFGVSYSTGQGQITQDGMVVGTAQYISPEQAQGQQATPQSDIYSLGVVAYEGLAGQRPFTGTTPVDIAAAHVNNPVPPLPDSVDVQLREFVMSMLAKDPLDRPNDALGGGVVDLLVHTRHGKQQRGAEGFEVLDHRLHIGAQGQRNRAAEAEEFHESGKHVAQRQEQQQAAVRPCTGARHVLQRGKHQEGEVAVGQFHALRGACRAGCVDDGGAVVAVGGFLVFPEFGIGDAFAIGLDGVQAAGLDYEHVAQGGYLAAHGFDLVALSVIFGDSERDFGIVEDPADLAGGVGLVHRHGDRADGHDRHVQRRPFPTCA